MSLEHVVETLVALRAHRESAAESLTEKNRVIRAYAAEAKDQGISGRRLAGHLADELHARGWTAEQIEQVGISPGAISAILTGP